ncbi:MAG: DUF4918 family protein [Candidatus Kapabacteria bacterium]|nr:DUF4918 family protein [Candidatus Kapabacteria bacterium]
MAGQNCRMRSFVGLRGAPLQRKIFSITLVPRHATYMASERFAAFVEQFLSSLSIDAELPSEIDILQPYYDPEVRRVVHEMCRTFYAGAHARIGVWGINPGRFGAGITGLSFTDPWAVENDLGIETTLTGRRELSAEFISRVISAYGGPKAFYHDVYMSALSPLGFIRNGVNINFYDDAELASRLRPQIIQWMNLALDAGVRRDVTIILGTGKLRQYSERYIRSEVGLDRVIYLDHPRYIMQYRRRDVAVYVQKYVEAIRSCLDSSNRS